MKLFGALVLTLSAATPASSIFVIVPDVIAQAGSGALIAMGIAAVIAVCVAQVYAELGSAFPMAGGEYAIVGRTLGPLAGFAVLGMNLVNSLLATAVLALGVGEYLGVTTGLSAAVPVAIAVVVGATLLGVLNIRTNALVTGLFVAVEIAALVVLAALGFGHPHNPLGELLTHPAALSGAALVPATPAAIGLAVAVAIFAYDGYGSAVYFGEELHEAPRRIGRAILWALAITVAAEIIPLTAALVGTPDLKALLGAKSPFGDFVAQTAPPMLWRVLSLGVALAIINAVIAMVLLTSRQLFSTGRDETWGKPVNAFLTRIHPRWGSPWAATLAAGGLVCGLCFIDQKFLLIATGTGVAAIYGALCVAALVGRRRGSTVHGPYRMPLFPLIPATTLVALAGVLFADWLDPEDGRPGLIFAAAVPAVFGAYYWLMIRKRGWRLREG
jgi:amino acid transporter